MVELSTLELRCLRNLYPDVGQTPHPDFISLTVIAATEQSLETAGLAERGPEGLVATTRGKIIVLENIIDSFDEMIGGKEISNNFYYTSGEHRHDMTRRQTFVDLLHALPQDA